MSRRQLAGLELRLHRVGQREQAKGVGDGRPALSHPLRDLLLGETVHLDQLAIGLRLLERRQILALEVLDQRQLEALRRRRLPDDDWYLLEAGTLGSAEPTLAGDQLVAVRLAPDDQRLEQAMAPDGLGERVESVGIEP